MPTHTLTTLPILHENIPWAPTSSVAPSLCLRGRPGPPR